jgi:hypothetical protein
MTTYEIREGLNGDILVKIEDDIESFVPMAEDNSDYQAYLNKDNPAQPIGGNIK